MVEENFNRTVLSTWVILLASAANFAQPANAQSVSGTGDVTPGLVSPDWTVGET
ncbi:hypothetical protein WJ969_11740 [Achromobacter xylosoxidans]